MRAHADPQLILTITGRISWNEFASIVKSQTLMNRDDDTSDLYEKCLFLFDDLSHKGQEQTHTQTPPAPN